MAVFHSYLNCSLERALGTSVWRGWIESLSLSCALAFRHHTEHLLHAWFSWPHLLWGRPFSHNKIVQKQKCWDYHIILRISSSARTKCSLLITLTHYSHQLPYEGSEARGLNVTETAAGFLFYADSVEWVEYKIAVRLFCKESHW